VQSMYPQAHIAPGDSRHRHQPARSKPPCSPARAVAGTAVGIAAQGRRGHQWHRGEVQRYSATGTAGLTKPVVTSPGRGGFGSALSLSYDSGSGNGPVRGRVEDRTAAITRETEKGFPRYQDDPDGHVHPQRRGGPGSRPAPNTTAAGGKRPGGGPLAAGSMPSRASGRGSKEHSPGSSAGATSSWSSQC
jgi:hypothetical protein